MELSFKHQLGLVCAILLLPALCIAQGPILYNRATFYKTSDGYGNPKGACGYGDYGRTVYNGNAAAVSGLWRDGIGCGACYEVRCKIPELCNVNGAYLVVTDYGQGDRTDFIMSERAFSSMARNKDASEVLFKYGVVDIDYKRVPCRYPGHNIIFKIDENSKNPGYFAVVMLYVGGTYDITAVEMRQENSKEWMPLRRSYGAVFDLANPPSGEIILRLRVSSSNGFHWVESKYAIPSDWKAGATYDSGIQLN